jgi:hypothetical protein
VTALHEDHAGDLFKWDTKAFGLGFWVNGDPGKQSELMGEGAYGWGSAYFPQYFVDPNERSIGLLMCQLNPHGGSNLNQRFKATIYQALK